MGLENRPVLEPNAAGIDIGAREIFVAVPPGRNTHPVQVFDTFTEDLHRLANCMWRHHGGDGIDRRLLDSTVRPSGGARIKTLLSECAAHEERAGTAYGLARMSVASISAFRGFITWGFPAGSGRLCDACSGAPPG